MVNPQAKEEGDNPISGMPALNTSVFSDARAGLEEVLEAVKKG